MANARYQMAKEALFELDAKIANLQRLRSAWETILNLESESEASPQPPSLFEKPRPLTIASIPVSTSSKRPRGYGSKTTALKLFAIQHKDSGISRDAILEESKRISGSTSSGYKFIVRMEKSNELRKENGRYFPTDAMLSNIEELRSEASKPTSAAMHREPATDVQHLLAGSHLK